MAAGYCSALTLIGNPSELYMHGTSFTLKMATTILAWPISSLVFLPVFKQIDGISIFRLENRFGCRNYLPITTTINSTRSDLISAPSDDETLIGLGLEFNRTANTTDLNSKTAAAFQLARMSYLWLPFFTMAISIVVATLVSLLTGGPEQQLDRFLAPKLVGERLAAKTKGTMRRLNDILSIYSSREHSIGIELEGSCERVEANEKLGFLQSGLFEVRLFREKDKKQASDVTAENE